MWCHPGYVSKPSDLLLVDMLVDRCCSNHFSNFDVPDFVTSGLVEGPHPEASHLTSCYIPLKYLGKSPCLALVSQGGNKDGVDELCFCFHWNARVF